MSAVIGDFIFLVEIIYKRSPATIRLLGVLHHLLELHLIAFLPLAIRLARPNDVVSFHVRLEQPVTVACLAPHDSSMEEQVQTDLHARFGNGGNQCNISECRRPLLIM
jgi:hypothetical protein